MKLHSININELIIPTNRQRKEFPPEKLVELADSISQIGLIQPVVVRKENGHWTLVAGERRVKAMLYVWNFGERVRCGVDEATNEPNWFDEGQVPCLYQGELDPITAFEVELEENIQRLDLTWRERATAVAQLYSLRQRQAEKNGKAPPTIADISNEVRGSTEGWNHEQTRREIIVAKHLDDPEVAEAKSTDEAFKVLKRKETARRHEELGIEVGKTFTSAQHQAHNLDSLEWLKGCDAESFDIILTDPPYGMGADSFGDSGGAGGSTGAHSYYDSPEILIQIMETFPKESFRIAKPQAHLYVFCDIWNFTYIHKLLSDAGWTVFRTPLIWHKPAGMRAPWPENGPQRKYEIILYAMKGKKPVHRLFPDVITVSPDSQLGHHAQKPVALFQDLLSRSAKPGDSVLDPFCGSGPIFPAAHNLQCKATGIDLDPVAYGISLKRIGELK